MAETPRPPDSRNRKLKQHPSHGTRQPGQRLHDNNASTWHNPRWAPQTRAARPALHAHRRCAPQQGKRAERVGVRSPRPHLSLNVTSSSHCRSASPRGRHSIEHRLDWSAGQEAHGSLATEVLVEAASSGGTITSCWSWRAICGRCGHLDSMAITSLLKLRACSCPNRTILDDLIPEACSTRCSPPRAHDNPR
jgi:hypothetical protein